MSPHSEEVVGLIPSQDFLCGVLPVPACVLSRYYNFFPQSKDVLVRLIGDPITTFTLRQLG